MVQMLIAVANDSTLADSGEGYSGRTKDEARKMLALLQEYDHCDCIVALQMKSNPAVGGWRLSQSGGMSKGGIATADHRQVTAVYGIREEWETLDGETTKAMEDDFQWIRQEYDL